MWLPCFFQQLLGKSDKEKRSLKTLGWKAAGENTKGFKLVGALGLGMQLNGLGIAVSTD